MLIDPETDIWVERCFEILEFLKGRPYDSVAEAIVSSISKNIRVITGGQTYDSVPNRINVYLKEGIISKISIEKMLEIKYKDKQLLGDYLHGHR